MAQRKAANMQITRECNNECVFCSNPQFDKEYTFEEAKRTASKLKKDGVTEIFLSGGEPTLCKFLFELVKYLKKTGIEPRMITNGVKLADKKIVKKLYDAGLRSINVSMHSHDAQIADKLSQKKGHFGRQLQGLKNCINQGMQVQINSTINSLNCRHLLEFVRFFDKNFPQVRHFVFNGLDPGHSDGILKSRAGENQWIVPKLVDFELELKKMADFLMGIGKTFRIERVPLCYMPEFEEFSTETRKIVKDESYITHFIEKGRGNETRTTNPKQFREKVECCDICKLNKICAGVQKEYILIHGSRELYPVFDNPENVISRIRNT